MNTTMIATLVAGGLTAATLAFAGPALAAPTGPGTVQGTVNSLQAQGYKVIVNKLGASPPAQCTVSALRPGQTYSRTDSGLPGAGKTISTTVTDKTVYLDVTC
ncbi:hypothetical protein BH09ACT8_BH09ACT8_08550 [soil metagenome]